MKSRLFAFAAFLMLPASMAFAQTVAVPQTAPGITMVECPPRLLEPGRGLLSGVPMQRDNPLMPTTEFLATIPQGWTFKHAQTYSGLHYEVLSHEIVQNRMNCYYGISKFDPPRGVYFVQIDKAIPGNQSCTAVSGFKFRCALKPVQMPR
jgi:hypothetical protein